MKPGHYNYFCDRLLDHYSKWFYELAASLLLRWRLTWTGLSTEGAEVVKVVSLVTSARRLLDVLGAFHPFVSGHHIGTHPHTIAREDLTLALPTRLLLTLLSLGRRPYIPKMERRERHQKRYAPYSRLENSDATNAEEIVVTGTSVAF